MNETLRSLRKENRPEFSEETRKFYQELGRASIEISGARQDLKPKDFRNFYKKSKRDVKKNFPEFEKIIDVIFGLREFVNKNDNVNYHVESLTGEQRKNDIIEMCAWQHDATEILIDFGWNKELQDRFWREAGKFFDIFSQYRKDFEGVRQGVVGQARAFLILRELGHNPQLADPKEDAIGVDFYISSLEQDEELITQIKDWRAADETTIDLVELGSPSLVVEQNNGKMTRFQEARMAEISKLRATCGEMSKKLGRQVRSVLIIFNERDFDFRTGRPKPELLEKMRKELTEKLK